jgi:hypothetical protein
LSEKPVKVAKRLFWQIYGTPFKINSITGQTDDKFKGIKEPDFTYNPMFL